jgi:AcrR family transcriptional regulator
MRDDLPLIVLRDGPERHERSDAAANRERILAAARILFASEGVGPVTMAEIAQAAGVGKGTLYRRFADKGELCLALVDAELRLFQNRVLATLREHYAAHSSPLAQLCWFLDALTHFQDAHLPLLYEAQRAGNLSADKALPHVWLRLTVASLLEAAVESGEAAADLDVEYLASALLAPLQAPFFRFERDARGIPPERMSAALCRLVQALRR